MKVCRYTVDICDACFRLEGQECHTPGCVFFLCGMNEVAEMLDRLLIKVRVDGELIPIQISSKIVSQ